MHSYSDGSRYKGLHVGFRSTFDQPVEVQFHSAASIAVKDATTRHYEVERSATATDQERAAARAASVKLYGSLSPPAGITQLKTLGGARVRVRKYGDSRSGISTNVQAAHRPTQRTTRQQEPRAQRNRGTVR